jgi:hypothetical protein
VNSEQLSPATPPEKLKSKVAPMSGPWSTTLLDMAAQKGNSLEQNDAITRRSLWQKALHKGYKNSPCINKNCLGCSLDPTLSPSVIKNLGATFCNIDPDNLTVDKRSKARNKRLLPLVERSKPKAIVKPILMSPMMTARQQTRKKPRRTEWNSSLFHHCTNNFILRGCNICAFKLSYSCDGCFGWFINMVSTQLMWFLLFPLVYHEHNSSD